MKRILCNVIMLTTFSAMAMKSPDQLSLQSINLTKSELIDASIQTLKKEYCKYITPHLNAKLTLLDHIAMPNPNQLVIKKLIATIYIGTYFFRYLATRTGQENSLEKLCHTESLWYKNSEDKGRELETLEDKLKWMKSLGRCFIIYPFVNQPQFYSQPIESKNAKIIVKAATINDALQTVPSMQKALNKTISEKRTFEDFSLKQKRELLDALRKISLGDCKIKYNKLNPELEIKRKKLKSHFQKAQEELKDSMKKKIIHSKKFSDILISTI